MSAVYTQVHFTLDFILEENIMNPDQTPKEQFDLGPYC